MTKVDIVSALAAKTGMTKAEAEKAFDGVFDVIIDALSEGEKVIVSGFGTFERKQRVARLGHDPRTNEEIHIPAMYAATFKPGKVLKEKVK